MVAGGAVVKFPMAGEMSSTSFPSPAPSVSMVMVPYGDCRRHISSFEKSMASACCY